MRENLVALGTGILFGLGLGISQMIDRERVLGFLDIIGNWDPTLAFVMGGAVLVTLISFRFILRRSRPLFGSKFYVPTRQDIDRNLVLGAALFGVGWGIAGYCPGPAITATVLGKANPFIFLVAMLVGSLAYEALSSQAVEPTSPATKPPSL
jgi:uncharacterized membrane protein YedE/YeeE